MRTRDGVRAALIESLRESYRRHVADRRRFVRLNDVHVAVVAPSSPSPNVSVDE
jgi:hypothetical protein